MHVKARAGIHRLVSQQPRLFRRGLIRQPGMIYRRGYALKGRALALRGDFKQKSWVSVLAFINVHGLVEYFDTEGTFDRISFVTCCGDFVYSKLGRACQ